MSGEKGSTYANALLQLIFQNTVASPMSGLGSGLAASGTAGSLYLSLHTADPTAGGNQSSSEISYTGYARVAVARSSGGFTVTGNSVSPAALEAFAASTGGTGGTAAYFGIGTSSSGAGVLLYAGPISPTIAISSGVTPELTTATAITES